MNLATVEKFLVPSMVIAETERALRDAGLRDREAFVLWSGHQSAKVFDVVTALVPAQQAFRFNNGLCVRVEGSELHKINTWLFENGHTLAAQIHSHPTDAYHSATDDAYPIVTTLGGLSIVTAYFCRFGLMNDTTALYRLARGGWKTVGRAVIEVWSPDGDRAVFRKS